MSDDVDSCGISLFGAYDDSFTDRGIDKTNTTEMVNYEHNGTDRKINVDFFSNMIRKWNNSQVLDKGGLNNYIQT